MSDSAKVRPRAALGGSGKRPDLRTVLIRIVLVVLGLCAWFGTQHLIGARHYNGQVGDGVLAALSPVHDYLLGHAAARRALLISSSLGIDLLGIFLLGRAIFGPSVRPFLGLLMLFALRQVFQAVCVLPMPEGMIWEYPGFPSLLVTYGVSNDLFFSGHTALAVYGAVELGRLDRRLIAVGVMLAVFEVFAVLSLRAHWTMDVYAGAVTAILVALFAKWAAPAVDRWVGQLG
jgi:membrane-associated phospholipid phosphatase